MELKFDCCPPSTSYISFQSSSGNFFQSQARIFFKTIHFSPMEHQISLSICLQEGQVQSCTVIRCDSRHERGDPTSPPLPSYLPSSSFPKEPLPASTSKSVSDSPDSSNPTHLSFYSPVLPQDVLKPTHGLPITNPHSVLNTPNTGSTPPCSHPFSNHSSLDAFRFTTSPRWTATPYTRLLFWWGFVFPPLWLYGSLHLFPPVRRRLLHPKRARVNVDRKSRRRQIISHLSRLRWPFSKGDVQVGTTTVVVVPRSKNSFDHPGQATVELDWNPACISAAERLDAAGIDTAEWLHQDTTLEQTLADQDKRERRGAYHCLLAFLTLSMIIAVTITVTQRIHWPNRSSSHLSTPLENAPSITSTNLIGGSSGSSPL